MSYDDVFFSREDRYSIGTETESGKRYVSIPVSNGPFDYEEYYELTPEQYSKFLGDRHAAIDFVESCRRHERDELLIEKPGWNRGTPV
jgi:hypothetical protein